MKSVIVAFYAGISSEKSLVFQVIFTIKIGAILFMLSVMLVVMKDQKMNYLFYLTRSISDDILFLHNAKKKTSVVALISKNAAIDKKI